MPEPARDERELELLERWRIAEGAAAAAERRAIQGSPHGWRGRTGGRHG